MIGQPPCRLGAVIGDLADLLQAVMPGDAASDYPLTDLAADIYLLRDGGTLAPDHISPDRLQRCRRLARHADATADPMVSVTAFWRRFLSVSLDDGS